LLAFSGFQWTRDYAERYVHTFFHVGIKIIFIYILVGLGAELAQGWSQVVVNAPWGKVLDYDIAVGLSAYIYYKLCVKVPDQAVSWLTGRLAMGFDAAADVKTGIKTAVKIPVAAAGLVAGIQGMNKAVSVASQVAKTTLESQDKKTNLENMGAEVVRTLGAAGKVEWEKKVDETKGGKLAKNILATIPKPKKATKRSTKKETKTDSNNDSMDYTI